MPHRMRIVIATDAWEPQVNGVVRTYQRVCEELEKQGHQVRLITPNNYKTIPCPTYPEIRLALVTANKISPILQQEQPDRVHIATEGPIGWATRRACLQNNMPFTTAYHTRFPEYVTKRLPLPINWVYSLVKRFHNAGNGTMVATNSLKNELSDRGFADLMSWTRGVNTDLFRPRKSRLFGEGPVAIYVGRVAVEKNLEAFLGVPFEGKKVIVGDGPSLQQLKKKYPCCHFTGAKIGEELAVCYSSSDVFVFPSLTDTFGIVLLEAMASGLPIAAYPVTGPIDIVEQGVTGVLDQDLSQALNKAMKLNRAMCREKALEYSWANCGKLFIENLNRAKNNHASGTKEISRPSVPV